MGAKRLWWIRSALISAVLGGSLAAAGCSSEDVEPVATVREQTPPMVTRATVSFRATTMTIQGGNPNLNVWHELVVTIGGVRSQVSGFLMECGGDGGIFGSGTSESCPLQNDPPRVYNYPDLMGFCPIRCVPSIARTSRSNYFKQANVTVPSGIAPVRVSIPLQGGSFSSSGTGTVSFALNVDLTTKVVTPVPPPVSGTDPFITELTDTCVTVDGINSSWKLCWEIGVVPVATPAPTIDAAPGGARLLTAAQFKRTVGDLLGPEAGALAEAPPNPVIPITSVDAFERSLGIVEASLYESNAIAVARQAVATRSRLAEQAPCVSQGPVDAAFRQACYLEVAQAIGSVAWRLPPSEAEKTLLQAIAVAGEAESTADTDRFASGLSYLIATVIESPSFLYSVELGEGITTQPGNHTLNPFELVTRLSLFLLGRGPSSELLQRAAAGELSTQVGIRAMADELLQRPEARDGFVDQLDELFQLKLLATKGKDPDLFPQFQSPTLAAAMREEVERFANDYVFDNPRSFLGVLTDEKRFVNAELAQSIYGVPAPASTWGLVDFSVPPLDQQKRAGIMTMPALMTILSHPAQNSIVRRGLFAQTYLFCQDPVHVPRGVDTTINVQPGTTLRQFFEAIDASGCGGCHLSMDGLAYAFESFDGIGRFRTTEMPGSGLPINTQVTFDPVLFDGVTSFGPHADARGWAQNAAALSPMVARCWVDQIYRNAVGDNAGPGQEEVLDGLDTRFASGHLVADLLADLVASAAFTQVGPSR